MNMTIEQEQAAIEYRLAEIEDETSQAHRDHAFLYFCKVKNIKPTDATFSMRLAWNYCHMLYCKSPKLIRMKPSPAEMFALYAIGVVSGIAIALIASFFIITPN